MSEEFYAALRELRVRALVLMFAELPVDAAYVAVMADGSDIVPVAAVDSNGRFVASVYADSPGFKMFCEVFAGRVNAMREFSVPPLDPRFEAARTLLLSEPAVAYGDGMPFVFARPL